MTTGTRASFAGVAGNQPQGIIYPELVHSGMVETLVQNTDAFNGASQNTIRLVTQRRMGDFHHESFFKNVSSLIARRDVTTASPENADVASSGVPVDETVNVKLNRRIGPIDQTYDSFRKLGASADLEVLSFLLGEQIAKAMQIEMLDSGLRSIVAAITAQAGLVHTPAGSPIASMTTADLVTGLSLFGDAASRVSMWVMHSKPFFDLIQSQITANIDGISNFNIAQASPVTLNRPVLVTDSAALINGSEYTTLGLVTNAVTMEDSEEEMMYTDVITGKENIVTRLQGEYAYNVGCKGVKWDIANGLVNPTDAALATTTNWDKIMDNDKDLGGIAIITK